MLLLDSLLGDLLGDDLLGEVLLGDDVDRLGDLLVGDDVGRLGDRPLDPVLEEATGDDPSLLAPGEVLAMVKRVRRVFEESFKRVRRVTRVTRRVTTKQRCEWRRREVSSRKGAK